MTQAVIFAGGLGTRLSELTKEIPKPMAPVGDIPIIRHLIEIYRRQGVKDFVLALGYKQEAFKRYFTDLMHSYGDIEMNFSSGSIVQLDSQSQDFTVKLIDTGHSSLTGTRLGKLRNHISSDVFHITYGDGLSDVPISEVHKLHVKNETALTITAVRPPARFGELDIDPSGIVGSFVEKPQMAQGWINGGFMVASKKIFNFLNDSEDEMFEQGPMNRLLDAGMMSAYKHSGLWQCMDSKRDFDRLNQQFSEKSFVWSDRQVLEGFGDKAI